MPKLPCSSFSQIVRVGPLYLTGIFSILAGQDESDIDAQHDRVIVASSYFTSFLDFWRRLMRTLVFLAAQFVDDG